MAGALEWPTQEFSVPTGKSYGRIVHIRKGGRGSRVVIDRGSPDHPLYLYLSGSYFSKETLDAAKENPSVLTQSATLADFGPEAKIKGVTQLPKSTASTRQPLTLLVFQTKTGGEGVLTKSEAFIKFPREWVIKTLKAAIGAALLQELALD